MHYDVLGEEECYDGSNWSCEVSWVEDETLIEANIDLVVDMH